MAWLDERIKVNPEAGAYPLGMGITDLAGEAYGRGFAALHKAMTDQPDMVIQTVPQDKMKDASRTEPPVDATTKAVTPQQAILSDPSMPTKQLPPTSKEAQATQQPAPLESGLPADAQVDYLKKSVSNRLSGTGDPITGLSDAPPQVPVQKQFAQQLDDWGTQVAFDQTKIPSWHESDSFNYALINFGLNLLSGNDLATSFGLAGKTFTDMFGREKRELWSEDLRQKGYSGPEIQQYIETGDSKVLTDPMERKAKLQQYNLAQAQLDQALYESSPEMRQYGLDRQAWEDQQALEEKAFNRDMKIQGLNLQREGLDIQRQEAAARRAATATKASESKQKYTEGYSKAQNHYLRAQQGLKNYETILSELPTDLYSARGVTSGIPGADTAARFENAGVVKLATSGDPMLVEMSMTMDPELTRSIVAEKEWLAPVMRKDSGSAVSANEWLNMGNIYFPRPTDTPEQRLMKQQARELVTLSMNPDSSQELKQVVNAYSSGGLPGLRLHNGQAYANDGTDWVNGWFKVDMY